MTTLEKLKSSAVAMATVEMETDPVPDEIVLMATTRAGKPVTVRDSKYLEAAMPGLIVSIHKGYLGTEITWYVQCMRWHNGESVASPGASALISAGVPSDYKQRGNIRLARETTGARWPTVEELKKDNTRYYARKDERNRAREVTLSTVDDVRLGRIATLVDEINLMWQELQGHMESEGTEVHQTVAGLLDVRQNDVPKLSSLIKNR